MEPDLHQELDLVAAKKYGDNLSMAIRGLLREALKNPELHEQRRFGKEST
jgi:metal-responsive CopG/Arc/MetJ family transcriptional regulator|tara:strand:- start:65 stop:214 length:150 start_codon:yes stop_codon:yes gene_type:complete